MWRFFEPELRKRLTDIEAEASYANRVRSCLFELLPSGMSSIDDVAKNLAIGKRTLQRQLSQEKTSFQQELNKTREKL
jgi:AraC-like DNA-binding protein